MVKIKRKPVTSLKMLMKEYKIQAMDSRFYGTAYVCAKDASHANRIILSFRIKGEDWLGYGTIAEKDATGNLGETYPTLSGGIHRMGRVTQEEMQEIVDNAKKELASVK